MPKRNSLLFSLIKKYFCRQKKIDEPIWLKYHSKNQLPSQSTHELIEENMNKQLSDTDHAAKIIAKFAKYRKDHTDLTPNEQSIILLEEQSYRSYTHNEIPHIAIDDTIQEIFDVFKETLAKKIRIYQSEKEINDNYRLIIEILSYSRVSFYTHADDDDSRWMATELLAAYVFISTITPYIKKRIVALTGLNADIICRERISIFKIAETFDEVNRKNNEINVIITYIHETMTDIIKKFIEADCIRCKCECVEWTLRVSPMCSVSHMTDINGDLQVKSCTIHNCMCSEMITTSKMNNKVYMRYTPLKVNMVSQKHIKNGEIFDDRGYIISVRSFIYPLLAVLISSALFVMISGLLRKDYMVFDGVDPTSLTSLVIVIEGLFLALITAVAVENWSWYDMIRGQIMVTDKDEWLKIVHDNKTKALAVIQASWYHQKSSKVISYQTTCLFSEKATGNLTLPIPGHDVPCDFIGLFEGTYRDQVYITSIGQLNMRDSLFTQVAGKFYHRDRPSDLSWDDPIIILLEKLAYGSSAVSRLGLNHLNRRGHSAVNAIRQIHSINIKNDHQHEEHISTTSGVTGESNFKNFYSSSPKVIENNRDTIHLNLKNVHHDYHCDSYDRNVYMTSKTHINYL